jgi:uncharacterized membrane protein
LSQTLTVEKGAIVQADVDVRVLLVSGTLVGNVVASESVRLASSARVVGDLASPRLAMESGAAYRGRVDMGEVEAARAAVASRALAKPAPAAAEARDRPAPPRMAPPPKTVASKVPARIPSERPAASEAAATAPPAFPRVAGVVGGGAPAWAKRKIRRR